MAIARQNNTQVQISEDQKVFYRKKTFWLLNWYVQVKVDSMGKDLIIFTDEKFDKIIVNGKEI